MTRLKIGDCFYIYDYFGCPALCKVNKILDDGYSFKVVIGESRSDEDYYLFKKFKNDLDANVLTIDTEQIKAQLL